MKKLAILSILLASLSILGLGAQESQGRTAGPAAGFSIGERRGDMAVGIELTSPGIFGGRLAARAGGELLYKEGIPLAAAEATWRPYWSAHAGLLLGTQTAGLVRLYGEFGGIAFFLDSGLTAGAATRLGIYGHFGFEFHFTERRDGCYFIELGSTGSFGARADAMEGSPLLANGFAAKAGFRWYF